jgi:hypothetical protein
METMLMTSRAFLLTRIVRWLEIPDFIRLVEQ